QLYDSAQGVYVNTSGDTSGIDTTWHIKTAFDTLTINVGINTEHWFFLKGRNSDSVATEYSLSDSLWSWAAVPDVVSAFAYNKDSVLIKLDPKLNPSYTFFALEDSVTGRFIDFAANRLRSTNVTVDSSWAWATYSEWGGSDGYYLIATPNTTYVFRAYAKEGIRR
ncbi:MAG: hypothetical protein IIB06_04025, partial [Bacteroidetes bacterium]|nr:hypothetical protein [Bacteroidota bacterium]